MPARRAPAGAKFQAVLVGIHFPFECHVPALGDAQGLKDAHRRYFRGGILAHNLTDDQLQGDPVLALHQQAKHQRRGCGS
jgi:hypothetical protein